MTGNPPFCMRQTIFTQKHGSVLELVLQANNERHVLTKTALEDIKNTLQDLHSVQEIHTVVLASAAEGYFSNGLDPLLFLDQNRTTVEENTRLIFEAAGLFFFYPRPTIAAINGHCMGAGSVFALYADYRLMSLDGGRFGFPEILISMSFPAFATQVLQDLVGAKQCRDLLFTGKALKAAQALEIGLVDSTYPVTELRNEALKLAQKLASNTLESLAAIKNARRDIYKPLLDRVLENDIQTMVNTILTKNCQEGFRALAEGRRPRFT